METRIALVGIMVENTEMAGCVNELLHQDGPYIRGRMGLPYPERGVNIVGLVIDAPQDVCISALSGKLGRLDGVSAKTLYAKKKEGNNNDKG